MGGAPRPRRGAGRKSSRQPPARAQPHTVSPGRRGGGYKNRAGKRATNHHQQPSGRTPLHDAPREPAPPARRGRQDSQRQPPAIEPGGKCRGCAGGQKSRQGGQRDARPRKGAGRHADPRRAAIFLHTLEGVGNPAGIGAGAHAGEERGDDGGATHAAPPPRPRRTRHRCRQAPAPNATARTPDALSHAADKHPPPFT